MKTYFLSDYTYYDVPCIKILNYLFYYLLIKRLKKVNYVALFVNIFIIILLKNILNQQGFGIII